MLIYVHKGVLINGCKCIYTYIYIYIYVNIYMHMHLNMYICTYQSAYMYEYMHTHIYTYMNIRIYTWMYTHTYVHIRTQTSRTHMFKFQKRTQHTVPISMFFVVLKLLGIEGVYLKKNRHIHMCKYPCVHAQRTNQHSFLTVR